MARLSQPNTKTDPSRNDAGITFVVSSVLFGLILVNVYGVLDFVI